MKRYLRNCAAFNCQSKKAVGSSNPAFFRFPQDEERCKIWCQKVGQNDLLNEEPLKELHKKYLLCSKHFVKNQFYNTSSSKTKRLRLISTAIPSPVNISSENNLLQEASSVIESKDDTSFNKPNGFAVGVPRSNFNGEVGKNGNTLSKRTIITRMKNNSTTQKSIPAGLCKTTELPYLEVCIYHDEIGHKSSSPNDKITYKYKDSSGSIIDIDVRDSVDKRVLNFDTKEDFIYKEGGKVITIKRSFINSYRLENNYYGPLKIINEISDNCENGIVSTRLERLDFTVTRKEDRSVSEQELGALIDETPNIIPSCKFPFRDDDFTIFSTGDKQYKIFNKALSFFKERSGFKQLELKSVEEIFQTSDETIGLTPITVLIIGPKKRLCTGIFPLKKDKLRKKKKKVLDIKRKKDGSLHSYPVDYVNWSHRGNVCFSDIKMVGIGFIDEILTENSETIKLETFDDSLSSTTDYNEFSNIATNIIEPSFPVGSKEHNNELWLFLCTLIKNADTLIEFQYDMDDEKWIEIKRTFNIFSINGESVPDIVLKVVARKDSNQYSLTYYLRCIGRLVKTGSLCSKNNVLNIIKLFSKEKYVCIGLDKEKFIGQVDENEMLRRYLKENAHLSIDPYETLHHRKCKIVVKYFGDVDNYKFQRGKKTICGPLIICQTCEALSDKMEMLLDSTLDLSAVKEEYNKPQKQRYGPVQSIKVNRNIKKLCTETVFQFVSDAQKESESLKRFNLGPEITSKKHKLDTDVDCSDEESCSNIAVTEEEFQGMVSIKSNSESAGKLDKSCEKCGFQAKSMLSLFNHMSSHVVGNVTTEECSGCNAKFSSREALSDHQKQNHSEEMSHCSICQQVTLTTEDFFFHMNSHRSSKPFVCVYCDLRHENLEAYKKHMKSTHLMETVKDMNFVCKTCHSYFYTQDHLFIHRLNADHLEKSLLKCTICNFTCSSVLAFQTHILNHNYDQREYHNLAICLECKNFFFSSYELEDHTKKIHRDPIQFPNYSNNEVDHTKQKPGDLLLKQTEALDGAQIDLGDSNKDHKGGFTCGKCFKIYGSPNALQKHTEEVSHSENNTEEQAPPTASTIPFTYSCNMCGMKFTSEYFLSVHMNFHATNHRPVFQCDDLGGYIYTKRTQSLDQMIREDHPKHAEKQQQQQMLQQQQQQINSYTHHFSAPQQASAFPEAVPPPQPHVIQAPPPADPTWNQHTISSELDGGTTDSVYNLLHL